MTICFPVHQDKGLESKTYSHFGSAPSFIIYDTESGISETITNANQLHAHGNCHPTLTLSDKRVDAVVVGGIGGRAVSGLNGMGTKVYQSSEETISVLVEKIQRGELNEISPDNACKEHHGCH